MPIIKYVAIHGSPLELLRYVTNEKKTEKCMCKDGLFNVLEKIRNADGLIIGSPNCLGDMTASIRTLYD